MADSTVMAQLLKENLVDNPYRLLTDPDKTLLDLSGDPSPQNINQRVLDNIRKKQTLIHNEKNTHTTNGCTLFGSRKLQTATREKYRHEVSSVG